MANEQPPRLLGESCWEFCGCDGGCCLYCHRCLACHDCCCCFGCNLSPAEIAAAEKRAERQYEYVPDRGFNTGLALGMLSLALAGVLSEAPGLKTFGSQWCPSRFLVWLLLIPVPLMVIASTFQLIRCARSAHAGFRPPGRCFWSCYGYCVATTAATVGAGLLVYMVSVSFGFIFVAAGTFDDAWNGTAPGLGFLLACGVLLAALLLGCLARRWTRIRNARAAALRNVQSMPPSSNPETQPNSQTNDSEKSDAQTEWMPAQGVVESFNVDLGAAQACKEARCLPPSAITMTEGGSVDDGECQLARRTVPAPATTPRALLLRPISVEQTNAAAHTNAGGCGGCDPVAVEIEGSGTNDGI